MSIKSILSAYSGDANKGSALKRALLVAKHHDAWLTGVLRHGPSKLERTLRLQMPREFVDSFVEAEQARIREVSDRFQAITAEADWSDRSDFVDLSDAKGISLPEFARSFDLVVTGVHSRNESDEHMSANPDMIALQSGRPVLVVPDGYHAEGLAEHALVAWDGKRSSARALGDAMSNLEEKAKVTILTVGSKQVPGTKTLLRNLERHGIDANLLLKPRQKSVAKTILSAAQEVSAELLVMGAFEHSKFSHDLFGGVTTDVIEKTVVPVFLSH